ncbi:hypothetical protein TWF718_005219 [Orbilia javanica]|uniref:Rhodopsin domain-containing protein n=1 Tax=Orbilia javanica TaxID=47235 RepID=A0AAN8RDF1_9PEZI
MGSPPHPQTDSDREFLRSLFPLLRKRGLPQDFEFPVVVDPNYVPPVNTFYCLITGVVFCVLTSCVVCLRLWIRSRGMFGMDDWAMLASFTCYCCLSIINLTAVFSSGLGFHLHDLSATDVRAFLILEFLHVIFLFSAIHLCRCSILHLFLRLSHLQSRPQQVYLKTVLGLSYGFLTFCIISEIAQCGPPARGFDLAAQFDGTCLGSRSMWLYGLLIAGHILLDALTIFPPLFVLARLPLAPGKKFNLIFLLVLGVFTMIFSGIRLYVFYQIMLDSYDLTWNATAVAFWGILESSLAAIIVCLPALNQIILKYIRRIYHGDERSAPGVLTTRQGVSIFERNFIFQGPRKVLTSSPDATASGTPEYLELGELGGRSKAATSMHRAPIAQRTANDSYLDITGDGSFYIEEDQGAGPDFIGHIAKPTIAHRASRRPSSPTISYAAAREAIRRQ